MCNLSLSGSCNLICCCKALGQISENLLDTPPLQKQHGGFSEAIWNGEGGGPCLFIIFLLFFVETLTMSNPVWQSMSRDKVLSQTFSFPPHVLAMAAMSQWYAQVNKTLAPHHHVFLNLCPRSQTFAMLLPVLVARACGGEGRLAAAQPSRN